MQTHDTLFTPTEAAVLTGLPLKAVNNAIDKKTVAAVPGEDGGPPGRARSRRNNREARRRDERARLGRRTRLLRLQQRPVNSSSPAISDRIGR
jgi:hypothetical protein